MAPNKKKGGRNNNKKKKGRVGNAPVASAARRNSQESSASRLNNIRNLPTFHEKADTQSNNGTRGGGYYEIYKMSTTRFWNWMKQALPNSRVTTVNDLKKGVDLVLEQNIAQLDHPGSPTVVVPKDVIHDLSVSIQYRQLVTDTKYGGGETGNSGDKGHKYMVEVLQYCRSVLKFGRAVAQVAVAESGRGENKKEQDAIGGRFDALEIEDDDEEEEEDTEAVAQNIRERKFPTFDAPEAPDQEIDIEAILINGDDRFQATALLYTMDDLMGAVESHYGVLKNVMRGQEEAMHQGSSTIQLLMECTVAANMATQSVHEAENILALDHPHMTSFYHLLALVFLPHMIADVEKLMDKFKQQQQPHIGLNFVAEIVECSFHNNGHDRIPAKIKKFAKKTGIQQAMLNEEARKIHMTTSMETQLAMEESHNQPLNAMFRDAGLKPHMWLEQHRCIGGDRCLINTQNIVQKLMDLVQENTKLVGKPGFWGPEFDENTRPAKRIRGDLDEPFASGIFPELVELCKAAPFHSLPNRSQLITVLDLLQQHMKGERTRPVPVALTFGVHALLTSIFILQGDGDLARIASYTKESYNKLFRQLEELSDDSRDPKNGLGFYRNLELFKNLVKFAQPVASRYDQRLVTVDPVITERLAFWNPLVGGEYMLYGTYMCSIGLGSATVDSLGQLRFTLHLYNALSKFAPSLKSVKFLHELDTVFARTKAVWVGGRPDKGSYGKHFWMAWGMNAASAAQKASEDICSENELASYVRTRRQQNSDTIRELDKIWPQEYSASYRRLVLQDLTDDEGVADYTILNDTKEETKRLAVLRDLLTHINITRDAMDDDEDFVLPVNFSAVGVIMLEFTNALSDYMGWDAIIDKVFESYPKEERTGKTMGGRRMTPGGFNASDLNLRRQGQAQCLGYFFSGIDGDSGGDAVKKVADFMTNFFSEVSPERYTFFVEKEELRPSAHRNPLEGSYPYGRTGRTPHDPLHAILHCKYSKRGAPLVRIIKPGRLTPFLQTPDGSIRDPYTETGSKLERGPSGKYRHITSFSLDEIIALGWDGATYTSTRGRHAANGYHVPFVVGYDSDSDDEYEPINIAAGKRTGTIGLSPQDNGLYMLVPDMQHPGDQRLVQIKNAR